MRDNRFIAVHRGGTLTKDDHILLITWSHSCVEKVLYLLGNDPDIRVINAIMAAKLWSSGKIKTGEAMKAAREAHMAAREYINPVHIAIARASGHAVATAHMADHSLAGALYALKALALSGGDIITEREWQNNQLPKEIKDMVISLRLVKEKSFKII